MTPKTNVKVSRSKCDIGGNVFSLISTAYLELDRKGKHDLAEEMQARIDKEANSPSDVLTIVKEYVELV